MAAFGSGDMSLSVHEHDLYRPNSKRKVGIFQFRVLNLYIQNDIYQRIFCRPPSELDIFSRAAGPEAED